MNDAPNITSGNAFSVTEANTNGVQGTQSSATPYLTSRDANVQFTSILTVGDAVSGYRMVGIPDGMGTYRLRFTDITNPTAGGTITAVLDGTEGGNMFDNMTVSNGKAIIQEDVGNQQHLGKIWSYDITTDTLTEIAQHDRARFGDVGVAQTAPFSQDEESSGVIDVSDILGAGTYLLNVQAHYNISDAELVEGGQLLMMRTNVTTGQMLVTTVTASDAENQTLTYSISGGVDAADFVIDPVTGRLSFAVAPNFEAPADGNTDNVYEVTVTVIDGTNPVTQNVQVTVTAVNETPVNTTATAVSVAENTTSVTTVTGTDAEAAVLSYAISGGADASKFAIHSSTGPLSFLAAPDFETPTDNGANNSYFVTVTVSDGVNQPVNKTIVVTVTNSNETPTDIALSNSTLLENAGANAVVGTLSGSDPDAGASLSFSLPAGFDNARFNISGTTLRANASFDFEAGSSYTVNVRVSDGSLSFDKQFTITILNVNEALFESNIFYNSNAASEKNFSLDQTGQRSMIRNAQIVFNGDVTVPTGPVTNSSFVLTRLGSPPTSIGLTVVSRTFVSGKTTVVLGFTSGTNSVSGSLNDGNYRLVIDYGALGIDGDGNGQTGGLRTINFHRFFGDSDGDRDVDSRDSANYRAGLQGNTSWRSLFDFDNDGTLLTGGLQDQQDKDAFFANFGKRLIGF